MTDPERNAVIHAIDLYIAMFRTDLAAVETVRDLQSARVAAPLPGPVLRRGR